MIVNTFRDMNAEICSERVSNNMFIIKKKYVEIAKLYRLIFFY